MLKPKDIRCFYKLMNTTEKHYESHREHYHKKWVFGAMLVNKNRIVYGFNHYTKTHPLTYQNQNYTIPIHAEIDVISRWLRLWDTIPNQTTLYLISFTKAMQFTTSSYPCDSCMNVILDHKISRLVYSENKENEFKIIEKLIKQY